MNICQNEENIVTIRYLCNSAYSDVLEASTNTLFPGTIPNLLCKEHVLKLIGQHGTHLAYKPTDIFAWLQPIERHIPPVLDIGNIQNPVIPAPRTNQASSKTSEIQEIQMQQIGKKFDMINVDFGFDTGLFQFLSPVNISMHQIDFGLSDSLFLIQ